MTLTSGDITVVPRGMHDYLFSIINSHKTTIKKSLFVEILWTLNNPDDVYVVVLPFCPYRRYHGIQISK